jgi:hypothetical protein
MGFFEMTLLARIREQVALIALLTVWLVIVLYMFSRMPPYGQTEPGQILLYVLMVVSVAVLFSFIPAVAILFGWYTGKKNRAAFIGIILFPVYFFLGFVVTNGLSLVWVPAPETLLFIAVLSGISGCAGYCAAQRTKPCLAAAIALAGVWVLLFLHALN